MTQRTSFAPFDEIEARSMDLQPRLATVAEELRTAAARREPQDAVRMLQLASGFERLALGIHDELNMSDETLATRH